MLIANGRENHKAKGDQTIGNIFPTKKDVHQVNCKTQ